MQKRVLALHDLAGFGRSSLVPIIAALSAAGHQCVPVPTAVFSTHMAIPGWASADLTGMLSKTAAQYERLGLRFDAIYAGFLSSEAQAEAVRDMAIRLRAEKGQVLIDPVMGDNGRIYGSCTPALCSRMRGLCAVADIITPNATEAALLLERDPSDAPRDEGEAAAWMEALHARYGAQVALTGLAFGTGTVATGYLSDGAAGFAAQRRIDRYYPGTGDLFASVMLGALLNGAPLPDACARASGFVRDCIAYTAAKRGDPLYGVQFERLLGRLVPPPEEAAE